ncbi:hypothetical protein AS850_09675 [Frondihabitans sp. 762G35]|uniref:hypothetical protein n=1 Tax=Frondihabitans sp. 762G35 TaxID=1446794 RepID=UPI000D21AB10|nr:hypothetical protein [Frondihabitans sp. 762G35]ARC57344.1 hypothetical protein AS850_09675 [Frondihabitans sp. 762G35]
MTDDQTTTSPAADSEAPGPDTPDAAHLRPEGVDDATVEAVGKLSEALEVVEQARVFLYCFHRLSGKADLNLGEAVELLRKAGHTEQADRLDREIVGRNVIEGRWTFQIIEDYDDTYYGAFREAERAVREDLVAGRKHLFESEMKEDRRTPGARHHESRPEQGV